MAHSDLPAQTSSGSPRRRGMRTGFTTGACAAAASRAATLALLGQQRVERIVITLPSGKPAEFTVHACEWGPDSALCSIIKDGGDDPDVTHGAEIRSRVRWTERPGIEITGGGGVGTVTRVGLGLDVGGPAINPVPRRMIDAEVRGALEPIPSDRGVQVEISVPDGEKMARKTLNGRLGIIGGISILGTTGVVRPYSTAAWRASVEQAVDVAAANDQRHIVLSTGGRSEQFAQRQIPELPEIAFVEMGIFTGKALERCVRRGVTRVTMAGMIGKLSKTAQGHLQTHVAGNQVDPPFLAGLARKAGADDELASAITKANTARHVQELAQASGLSGLFDVICLEASAQCAEHVRGRLQVNCLLFDFDGTVLGHSESSPA